MGVSPKELGKDEHDRGELCAFLGADYTTRDGALLLHFDTNKLIHRRSFRAYPHYYPWRARDMPKRNKTDALERAVDEVLRARGMDDDGMCLRGERMRMMMKKNRNNMKIMKIMNHPMMTIMNHQMTSMMSNITISMMTKTMNHSTMKTMSTMTNTTTSMMSMNVMNMMSSTTTHTTHMKRQ